MLPAAPRQSRDPEGMRETDSAQAASRPDERIASHSCPVTLWPEPCTRRDNKRDSVVIGRQVERRKGGLGRRRDTRWIRTGEGGTL